MTPRLAPCRRCGTLIVRSAWQIRTRCYLCVVCRREDRRAYRNRKRSEQAEPAAKPFVSDGLGVALAEFVRGVWRD